MSKDLFKNTLIVIMVIIIIALSLQNAKLTSEVNESKKLINGYNLTIQQYIKSKDE